MQKVNVFAQLSLGKTFYKSMLCPAEWTLEEVIETCHLNMEGIKVYLDGAYISASDLSKTMTSLKAKNPAFLSIEYFTKRQ